MPRAFADITFTHSVKAAQQLYGSRDFNKRFETAADARNAITEMEAEFIHTRDSFYQASVGENGWPYVQHRGGPQGFLRVLDERTIAYADFSGNRQYISVGNINADERVSLFLIDYATRRRLKIWGRATILHENDNPELIAILDNSEYPAKIERALVIQVEALEWNCSKHITPRFSESEIKQLLESLVEENAQLKARVATLEAKHMGLIND